MHTKFLLNLSEEVPVIDTLGFIQSDGLYADSGNAGCIRPGGLQEYAMLQYAHLFGRTRTLVFLTESR